MFKKKVLRFFWNDETELEWRIFKGREFQILGAHTANGPLSPQVLVLDFGCTSKSREFERRFLDDFWWCNRSARCWEQKLLITLYTTTRSLKTIRYGADVLKFLHTSDKTSSSKSNFWRCALSGRNVGINFQVIIERSDKRNPLQNKGLY